MNFPLFKKKLAKQSRKFPSVQNDDLNMLASILAIYGANPQNTGTILYILKVFKHMPEVRIICKDSVCVSRKSMIKELSYNVGVRRRIKKMSLLRDIKQ